MSILVTIGAVISALGPLLFGLASALFPIEKVSPSFAAWFESKQGEVFRLALLAFLFGGFAVGCVIFRSTDEPANRSFWNYSALFCIAFSLCHVVALIRRYRARV